MTISAHCIFPMAERKSGVDSDVVEKQASVETKCNNW